MSQERDTDEGERHEISESDLEEGIERMENWRKCTQCNRPCSGHKGPTGSSCEKEPLNEEQLREYYKKLKRELKGKKTGSKTPRRNQRSISASTAPDVTGNASGSSSVPTKASPGTRGQASGDSDVISAAGQCPEGYQNSHTESKPKSRTGE